MLRNNLSKIKSRDRYLETSWLENTDNVALRIRWYKHGWGNHPGKSGHGLTNILTLYVNFEYKQYMYFSEQLKQYYTVTYAA